MALVSAGTALQGGALQPRPEAPHTYILRPATIAGGGSVSSNSTRRATSARLAVAPSPCEGTFFCRGGRLHPPAAVSLAELHAPAGQAALASHDLADLCLMQLGMLYQMLAKTGQQFQTLRTTVYARAFQDVAAGHLSLQRVAAFPPGGSLGEARSQDTLLLQTDSGWSLQDDRPTSGFLGDCLLHQEVVALPNSGALLFPLVDVDLLVGILLVEVHQPADQEHSSGGGTSSSSLGDGGSNSRLVQLVPGQGDGHGTAGSLASSASGGLLPALCVEAAPVGGPGLAESGGAAQQLPKGLSDDALHCLRLTVPLLAKACAMHARSGLQLLQASAQAAAAQSLVREARRPLNTLNTFGTMLTPRLKEGEPERDLAKGILLQGKRLSELLWQLEDAFHGVPPPVSGQVSVPTSVRSNRSLASEELRRLPQLPDAAAAAALPPSLAGGRGSASAAASVLTASGSAAHEHDVDGSRRGGAAVSSTADAFTLRQPAYSPAQRPSLLAPRTGAATATIDLEPEKVGLQNGDGRLVGPSANSGVAAGTRSGSRALPASALTSCNIISALTGLLTAACKMAAVSGINLIINSPLSAALPRSVRRNGRQPHSAQQPSSSPRQHTGHDSLKLIPRPPRPLLVGVSTVLTQKIYGYVLDIALQCTPRGGQLCVSARQDGSGVQLVLLHTGRMDLHRLHVRSQGLAAAQQPRLQQQQPRCAALEPAVAPATSTGPGSSGPSGGLAPVAAAGAGAMSAASRDAGLVGIAAPAAAPAGRMASSSGSAVLSVAMAQELAQQAGGHITVSYPCNMVNAKTGTLDVGTSVEIWLPGPNQACASA